MQGDNITDSEGLRRAYNAPSGIYDIGGVVYISGTRNLFDISHDWIKLPQGHVNRTKKYQDATSYISELPGGKPKRLVGHSLGASVAQAIGERFDIETRAYGSPAYSIFGSRMPEHTVRYKRDFDPVGILDRQAQASSGPNWWPHSYAGYETRSNETVSRRAKYILIKNTLAMVQTKNGALGSPWIRFIKDKRKEYHESKKTPQTDQPQEKQMHPSKKQRVDGAGDRRTETPGGRPQHKGS